MCEGKQRMASFPGGAECFTVMDVPHGDPVSDAFGARRGGVLSGVSGGVSVPCCKNIVVAF